ncbi:MAG TPA: YceI family protein [Methylomirabilota bacterium]|jgi:polyisoprenoid-binding protein YceI|nr:YceI family protein [Methylomirabilota bacterium]
MRRFVLFAGVFLALRATALADTSVWEIDPAHTSAQFAIRHLMVSTVRGEFSKVTGTVALNEQDPTQSTVEATIDAASLNTRIAKRDEHLKSPDFFDVAQYPTITFKSKKIEAAGDGKFKITGDLTMHGVTKEVVLNVEGTPKPITDPTGKLRIGGGATTRINRKDFGINYNRVLETGGVVVGDEVDITIDVELTQKQSTAAVAGGAQ